MSRRTPRQIKKWIVDNAVLHPFYQDVNETMILYKTCRPYLFGGKIMANMGWLQEIFRGEKSRRREKWKERAVNVRKIQLAVQQERPSLWTLIKAAASAGRGISPIRLQDLAKEHGLTVSDVIEASQEGEAYYETLPELKGVVIESDGSIHFAQASFLGESEIEPEI